MQPYEVIARKYRPRRFSEVIGQEAIVTTLKNALKQQRLAHAYLFSGPRGTGKTTLARILAKSLNCSSLSESFEPCGTCTSCKEIISGASLDVIEIDGASNRGIEDIRQINETVGYSPAHGHYKIYIIDEVHMLTKEAFNALLKTLEEPPATVKFFFATTEPSKVLPTILSRCQRFQLSAIAEDALTNKLQTIASDLKRNITPEGLTLLAKRAEGGLRDAESLLDQVLAFHEGPITEETVAAILGLVPSDLYFHLDQAGKTGDFKIAFEISEQLFREGKELNAFLDGLIDHFRAILNCYWSPNTSRHNTSKDLYTQSQCLDILEDLVKTQSNIRHAPSPRFALEALLLRILRSHHKISLDQIVHKLHNLQSTPAPTPQAKPSSPTPQPPPMPAPQPKPAAQTPSAPAPHPKLSSPTPEAPSDTPFAISPSTQPRSKEEQSRLDTLFQFAAAELNGSVEKK